MNLGRQKPSAGQALMFGNRARPVRKHGLPVLALAALTLLFYRDVLRAGPQAIIHGSDLSQAYYWKVYSKHLLLEGYYLFGILAGYFSHRTGLLGEGLQGVDCWSFH